MFSRTLASSPSVTRVGLVGAAFGDVLASAAATLFTGVMPAAADAACFWLFAGGSAPGGSVARFAPGGSVARLVILRNLSASTVP